MIKLWDQQGEFSDHERVAGRARGCRGGSSATNNFEPKGIICKAESTNSGDKENCTNSSIQTQPEIKRSITFSQY